MGPRIVIVGGVAGGMSAATRARRLNEHASITVLEKGGYISFANCGLPYFIGGKIVEEDSLFLTTPQRVRERFRIDARVHHEVTHIDRKAKRVQGIDHTNGQPFELIYDKLILAPGASPILPDIAGTQAANAFVLRSVEDAQQLMSYLSRERPSRAVVVGAGFIGLEMVEALYQRGLKVQVVDKAPHALPALDPEMSGWIESELSRHGVEQRFGVGLSALLETDDRITQVLLESGETLETDLVLLSMGVRPSVRLAELAGIAIGAAGGIQVDKALRTSDPDVYAVGDAAQVIQGVTHYVTRIPLAGAANRHGRASGEHAATGQSAPAATVFGTAIVRVFGLDVGITGLGRRAAQGAGFDVDTAIVHPNDHASYYPGAHQMHLELIYDRQTGKVLGAQAVGPAGVDKRIDVIATSLHFGATLEDLAALDLCYAPQFSGAKDPVHYAAYVAQNQRRDLTPGADVPEPGAVILDVRSPAEVARGALPGAVSIPLEQLRERLEELDPDIPTVVYCEVGIRAHAAVRILRQHGFVRVENLKGGYRQAYSRLAS